jgi:predicted metal-dependent hydrolase
MKQKLIKQTPPLPARTVEVDGLGTVLLAKSKKARRLSMTVKPYKGIRVAIPYRTSFKDAMQFLASNFTWAQKNLQHIKQIEQHHQTTVNDQPKIDKQNARTILVNRLNQLAAQHGFTYNRAFVRNQKTLWGSCSHKNNINLNINLIKLNPALTDYVILHELVHTRVKNHSKKFWHELDKYVGNSKILDRELKKHILGLSIY